ncbi:hypothetical protein Pmani_027483 [Petrolisthes manimaculis]|uniref:Uncharacterized protein n=1 Tax=Petrolisthes manimaculis TaxID=1843537 RepID=A0AAE1P3Y6_9EUCA|nr:hypothetical protein Pmani_027483 [Petrolisthes manimaculis]
MSTITTLYPVQNSRFVMLGLDRGWRRQCCWQWCSVAVFAVVAVAEVAGVAGSVGVARCCGDQMLFELFYDAAYLTICCDLPAELVRAEGWDGRWGIKAGQEGFRGYSRAASRHTLGWDRVGMGE